MPTHSMQVAGKGWSEVIDDEDWRLRFFRELQTNTQQGTHSHNATGEPMELVSHTGNEPSPGRDSIWDTRLPVPSRSGPEPGGRNSQMGNEAESGKVSIWDTVLPGGKI
jgi:hypothetical protein